MGTAAVSLVMPLLLRNLYQISFSPLEDPNSLLTASSSDPAPPPSFLGDLLARWQEALIGSLGKMLLCVPHLVHKRHTCTYQCLSFLIYDIKMGILIATVSYGCCED